MQRTKKCRGFDKEAETLDYVEVREKFKVYIGMETKEQWDKLPKKSNGELIEKIKIDR